MARTQSRKAWTLAEDLYVSSHLDLSVDELRRHLIQRFNEVRSRRSVESRIKHHRTIQRAANQPNWLLTRAWLARPMGTPLNLPNS